MKFIRTRFFGLPREATWCGCILVCLLALTGLAFKESNQTATSIAPNSNNKIPVKVDKTEEQWKESLTPEQFRILRKAGTERPNGKVYDEFKKQGTGVYFCVGCDTELFSSNEKFDSHCGWPSFFDPSQVENVKTSVDYLLGYPRTEVLCAVCDGHLGHVFTGEGFDTPTDKRYCINGTVLRFVPAKHSDSEEATK
jgi:peptide-methionine (R)-S-oxide reductase